MTEQGYVDSLSSKKESSKPGSSKSGTEGLSIKGALQWAKESLTDSSPSVQLDCELLLSFVLKKERIHLWTWPDKTVSLTEQSRFESLVEDRKNGVPIAYLLGQREFWGLPLNVTRDTLIPRPETELLVELLLSKASNSKSHRIADLGTGSGAIALAIASELTKSTVVATDKSWAALDVAKGNAANLKLNNVICKQGSWCAPLEASIYDFIVSNPPYIDKSDPHLKQGDVRYEPRSALVADDNGIADIAAIIQQAPHHLMSGGMVAFEHGFEQGEKVRELLLIRGFINVETIQDLAGLDRVTFGLLL